MPNLCKLAILGGALLLASGCGGWPWWEKREPIDPALYAQSGAYRVEQTRATADLLKKASLEEQTNLCAKLAQQMQNESDPLVRLEIVKAATLSSCPQAVAILYGGLKDPYQDVRIASCKAYGKRNAADAAHVLGEVLASDLSIDVRLAAAKALGDVKDPSAVISLGVALDDTNPALRYRITESLKTSSGKDFGDNVPQWQQYARSLSPGAPPAPIAEHPYPLNR
ncbi:MAG TPA: HEAT repeat domain-containing protein [Pirellulales bacterium]|jgi:HEAT repeat protein|nr:HEAT repeat domain-containing protein [Pirellulales bacterium]